MDKVALITDGHDVHEGALHRMFDEAYSAVGNDRTHAQGAAHTTVEVLKSGTLYVPSLWGKAACAALYAADEVKHDDPKRMFADIGIGAAKGAAFHSIGQAAILQRLTPVAQGVISGLSSRLTDKALTPTTYEHPSTHNFDGQRALSTMIMEIGNVPAMVRDATGAKFAASALGRTAEAVEEKTHLSATISGAIKTLWKQGTQIGDPAVDHREQVNAVKALESLMVPSTAGVALDDPNGTQAEQQRAARVATIEVVERFVMGQSQRFENAGRNSVYRQLLDYVRSAKYLNSLPTSKAG